MGRAAGGGTGDGFTTPGHIYRCSECAESLLRRKLSLGTRLHVRVWGANLLPIRAVQGRASPALLCFSIAARGSCSLPWVPAPGWLGSGEACPTSGAAISQPPALIG